MKASLIAAALLTGAQAAQQDVIKLKAGGEAKGKISIIDSQKIVYADAAGKAVTLKNEDVAEVTLFDVPASLKNANAAAATKNWEKAFNLYDAALGEIGPGKARDLNKQYVLYGWALALD